MTFYNPNVLDYFSCVRFFLVDGLACFNFKKGPSGPRSKRSGGAGLTGLVGPDALGWWFRGDRSAAAQSASLTAFAKCVASSDLQALPAATKSAYWSQRYSLQMARDARSISASVASPKKRTLIAGA